MEAYAFYAFLTQMTEANASEELVLLFVSEESIDYKLSGRKTKSFRVLRDNLECF